MIGISVGINDGTPPPLVPSTTACYSGERQIRSPFVWLDVQSNTSVIVDMHPGGYGGILPINPDEGVPYYSRDGVLCDCIGVIGFDEVLCYAWKGDNYGPANLTQVEANFETFYRTFPNAKEVAASTLSEYWLLLSEHQDKLEVVTSEIGDTWMYGSSSDPLKLATMRYMMRARAIEDSAEDNGYAEFSRLLLKLPEHTWGSCGSGHMHVSKPKDVWTSSELAAAVQLQKDPFYTVVQESWDEQRLFMTDARTALTSSSSLATALDREKEILTASPPTPLTLLKSGYSSIPADQFQTRFALGSSIDRIQFDVETSAVSYLHAVASNVTWTSSASDHPMFRFMYRSHSYEESLEYSRSVHST